MSFENIDESRVYGMNWRDEIGCDSDEYYTDAELRGAYTVYPLETLAIFRPHINIIDREQYKRMPKNWSMNNKIEDKLFIDCWSSASTTEEFQQNIFKHIKESVGDTLKGEGWRPCAVPSKTIKVEVKDEELILPGFMQPQLAHGGEYTKRSDGTHCCEIKLNKKVYFTFPSSKLEFTSDHSCFRRLIDFIDVPRCALMTGCSNGFRDYHEKRRKSLEKKLDIKLNDLN